MYWNLQIHRSRSFARPLSVTGNTRTTLVSSGVVWWQNKIHRIIRFLFIDDKLLRSCTQVIWTIRLTQDGRSPNLKHKNLNFALTIPFIRHRDVQFARLKSSKINVNITMSSLLNDISFRFWNLYFCFSYTTGIKSNWFRITHVQCK